MEEYEVRDTYFRLNRTSLRFRAPQIIVINRSSDGNKLINARMRISVHLENIGNTIERDFKLEIKIPIIIGRLSSQFTPVIPGPMRIDGDFNVYSVPNKSPIFQGEVTNICSFDLLICKETINAFIENRIYLNLFYSGGIEKFEINLGAHAMLDNRQISPAEFK